MNDGKIATTLKAVEVLLDGSLGQYLPQLFAQGFNWDKFDGLKVEDIDILLEGPTHEHYWEAWLDVLDNGRYVPNKALPDMVWTLHQDSDLFLVNSDLMTDEEYLSFFEVEREPHEVEDHPNGHEPHKVEDYPTAHELWVALSELCTCPMLLGKQRDKQTQRAWDHARELVEQYRRAEGV